MLTGVGGFAARVLRDIDDQLERASAAVLSGNFTNMDEYRAACATRRTWMDARAIVTRTLGTDDD